MLTALVARREADDPVRKTGWRLAPVRTTLALFGSRQPASSQKSRRVVGGSVRVLTSASPEATGQDHRQPVGAETCVAAVEAIEASSVGTADVSGSRGRAAGQQPRRAGNPPGGDHAQEQPGQRERGRRCYASGAEEHLPNPETPRARSGSNGRQRRPRISEDRTTPTPSG
jgi:hypothetical protein